MDDAHHSRQTHANARTSTVRKGTNPYLLQGEGEGMGVRSVVLQGVEWNDQSPHEGIVWVGDVGQNVFHCSLITDQVVVVQHHHHQLFCYLAEESEPAEPSEIGN